MTVLLAVLAVINILLFASLFVLKERIRKMNSVVDRHEKDLATLIVHTQAVTEALNYLSKDISVKQDEDIDTFMSWYMTPKTEA